MDNPQRSFKLFEKRSETKQLWALISLRYSPTPRETLGIVIHKYNNALTELKTSTLRVILNVWGRKATCQR